MNYYRTILIGVCALMISACGSTSNSLFGNSDSKISGEVFIITRGSKNEKIGLVSISAVSAKKFVERMKTEKVVIINSLDEFDKKADKCWQSKKSPSYESKSETLKAFDLYESGCYAKKRETIKSALQTVMQGWDTVVSRSTSNADGKFELTGNFTEETIIVASGSRNISGTTEDYYWIVPVPEKTQQVILSNNNLLSVENLRDFLKLY